MKKLTVSLLLLLLTLTGYALDSKARWIWRGGSKPANGEVLYLRTVLNLKTVPESGFINVVGDDAFTFYLNGEKLLQGGFKTEKINATKLKAGDNVLAARVKNDRYNAGLLVYGEIQLKDTSLKIFTDRNWKVFLPAKSKDCNGWEKNGFNDDSWENAVEICGVTDTSVWKPLIKINDFLTREEWTFERDKQLQLINEIKADTTAIKTLLAGEKRPESVEFTRINNVPFINIDNGRKLLSAPYINSSSYKTSDPLNYRRLKRYGNVGYDVAMFRISMAEIWKKDGKTDTVSTEESLLRLLAAFPKAYIIANVSVDPPKWFLDEYPDELIGYAANSKLTDKGDVKKSPVRRPSMASEKWMKMAGEALAEIIEKIERSEGGKRIIAYHVNYGVYAEWHYYGMYDQLPDTGQAMQKAWKKYLKQKYGSNEKLQSAWKDRNVTFENANIPSMEKRLEQKDGTIIRAGNDCRCQDFYDCVAKAVNECQTFFNKTVRAASINHPIIGNYSGYFFWMPYPAVGWHLRTPEMLQSEQVIDFQTSPFSYGHRASGSSGLPRSVLESYAINGKVGLLEADNRTHQAFISTRGQKLADSVGQISREFCNSLTRGAALWYFDFANGWYDYPEYEALFKQFLAIWREKPDAARISEIAGVCDFESASYHTAAVEPNEFTKKIISETANEMHYTGAPFDTILVEDLANPETPHYKIYVFYNLVHVTPEKLKAIKDLVNRGALLVFICSPDLEPVFKNNPNVIFTGNKPIKRNELRELVKKKGIHIYTDDAKSVLFASRGLVGIHRSAAGNAEIKLPKLPARIQQILPVRKDFAPTKSIKYNHTECGSSLFRIEY